MALTQKEKSARYYQKHKEEISARHKAWRESNKEQRSAHAKEWYQANREDRLVKQRERKRLLHKLAIEAYGGKCEFCGEDHLECLTIDHSFNDGGKFRKENPELFKGSGSFYVWLKNKGYPKDLGLRVLCWNCNCSKGLFGYSPYEVENGKLART
jgi:hypothetical protein